MTEHEAESEPRTPTPDETIAAYLEEMAAQWAEGEYIKHYLLGEARHLRARTES